MHYINYVILVVFLACTIALYAQDPVQGYRQPQETRDTLQDERIVQLDQKVSEAHQDITKLALEISGLRSSIDKFTGIGIGMGALLSVLQVILILVNYKKSK